MRAPGAKDSPVGIVGTAGGGGFLVLGEFARGLEVLGGDEGAGRDGGEGDQIVHRAGGFWLRERVLSKVCLHQRIGSCKASLIALLLSSKR
jgi:hypothetical protein